MNKKEQYTERINLRVTPLQKKAAIEKAALENLSVCDSVRNELFNSQKGEVSTLQLLLYKNFIFNIIQLEPNIPQQSKNRLLKEVVDYAANNFKNCR